MKVLICITSLSGGGAERQISYLLAELASRGIETHVAYLFEGPILSTLNDAGVMMHPIKHLSNYDPMIIWRIVSLIQRIKPDIVQSCIVQMDIFTGIACIVTKTPWIFREANSEIAARKRGKKEFLRRFVSAWASYIVANSKSGLDYWERLRPNINKKFINNGLPDDPLLNFKVIEKRNLSHTLVYAGRLTAHKNVSTLLKAFAQSDINETFQLVICGKGEYENKLKELAKELNIHENVDFLGYVEQIELLKIMREATLFINPSTYEGCPNTVLEAMACACPIAVSDIPAHRSILNNDSACFFETTHIDELKQILNSVNKPNELIKRGISANKNVKKFSVKRMLDKYLDVYNAIIDSHKVK